MDHQFPIVQQGDAAFGIFVVVLLAAGFGVFFLGPVVRLFVGITDLTVGLLTLYYPRWFISDFGGKVLPYYFEEQYDD